MNVGRLYALKAAKAADLWSPTKSLSPVVRYFNTGKPLLSRFHRALSTNAEHNTQVGSNSGDGEKNGNSIMERLRKNSLSAGGSKVKLEDISKDAEVEQQEDPVCASCGIKLQDVDKNAPGYYKGRKSHADTRKFGGLSAAKEKMVLEREKLFLKSLRTADKGLQLKPKRETVVDQRLFCERCLDIMHRSKFTLKPEEFISVEEVMGSIPTDANAVHVVSALDFPLGLSKHVSQNRDKSKLWYIVTKADAFFDEKVQLERLGLSYFRDSVAHLVGGDPKHVFLVSGKLGWNTENLLAELPAHKMYFVGSTNSGKSTLIRTLIYRDDRTLKSTSHYGPGISNVPGLTVNHMKYRMKHTNAILVDTPGFWPKQGGVYKYLEKESVKELSKVANYASATGNSKKIHTPEIHGKKTFNGSRVYTIGGLFYLRPPVGAIIRVFVGMHGAEASFRSISRAIAVSTERNVTNEKDYLVNNQAACDLIRYVIPPFYGSIDIVLRDVGYVMVSPCGKFTHQDTFEIYVPRGIEVIVRESIFKYIYKTKSARDETGNLLSKRNISRRGSPVLKRVPEDRLIFSSLYPVPREMLHKEAMATVVPNSSFQQAFNPNNPEARYPNTYWRMPSLK